MIKEKSLIFTLLSILLFFGCNDKKNLTGFESSNVVLDSLVISNNNWLIKTYQDSTKTKTLNPKLTFGNYEREFGSLQSYTLIRFPNTPDSISEVSDIKLQFKLASLDFDHNFTLHTKKMLTNWSENTVNQYQANSDSTWDWPNGESINWISLDSLNIVYEVTEDSLFILDLTGMENIIKNEWSGDENYGLAFSIEEPNIFFEAYSSENTEETIPELSFSYTSSLPDSIYEYKNNPIDDTFFSVNPDNFEVIENRLIFSNNLPHKNIIKFNLDKTLFINNTTILDTIDVSRIVINRAELILHKKDNPENYSLLDKFTVCPFALVDEPTEFPLKKDDYKAVYNQNSSIEEIDDEVMINITYIFQQMISNQIENHGLLLTPYYMKDNVGYSIEGSNYDYLEFDENNIQIKVWYSYAEIE